MRSTRAAVIVFALFAARTEPSLAGTLGTSDLGVTKSAPATAPADSDVAFALSVTNIGPDDADTITLNDPIPAGMTFVSLAQDTGPAFACANPGVGANGPITCTLAILPSGVTANFTLTVHIAPATPPGTVFTNIATVSTASFDPNSENDQATAGTATPGPPSSDFFVLKQGPGAAMPDTDVAYTITVGNAGPDPGDASWTDTLPGTMTFVSLTPNAGCTTPAVGAGGAINCTLTNIAPGGSIVYTLTGHIPSGTQPGATFSNTAAVTSSTDSTPENDQESTTLTVSTVDVAVAKSGPPSVTAGQTATYTLTITNNGPDSATSVLLDDTLPAPMTVASFAFDSGATPSGCSTGTTSVSCSWNSLGNLQSATFTLIANVNGAADGSTLTNTVTATSAGADSNPSNNSAPTTATAIGSADLAVGKTAPAGAFAGQDIPFTLSVGNAGPSPAGNVVLSDTLPTGARFVSLAQNSGPVFGCATPAVGSGGVVTCTLAQLAAGGAATFTLVVDTDNAFVGPLANTASASTSTPDPNAGNDSASATVIIAAASADLAFDKTAPSTGFAGQNIPFTLSVSNAGPSPADNVVVADTLPAAAQFVSLTQNSGPVFGCTTPPVGSGGVVTCTIAQLAPGGAATFTLVLRTDSSFTGPLANTAAASTSTTDPGSGNNAATATVDITAAPAPVVAIPTLSGAMLLMLGAGLAAAALARLRR